MHHTTSDGLFELVPETISPVNLLGGGGRGTRASGESEGHGPRRREPLVPGLSKGTYLTADGQREVVMLYDKDVRVYRPTGSAVGGGRRGCVDGMTRGSAKRLRHAVVNNPVLNRAGNWWVGLTYPGEFTENGREVKRHLDRLLKRWARRGWAGVWGLEYQERGAPHFHLILNAGDVITQKTMRLTISVDWFECVGSGDERHLRAGTSCSRVKSSEGACIYLTQYIVKQDQKKVPEGVYSPGRMWGVFGTRTPEPVIVEGAKHERHIVDLVRVVRRGVRSESSWKSRQPHKLSRGEASRAAKGLWSAGERTAPLVVWEGEEWDSAEPRMISGSARHARVVEGLRTAGPLDPRDFGLSGGARYRPRSGGLCGLMLYGGARFARAALSRGIGVRVVGEAERLVTSLLGGRVVRVEKTW